MSLPRLTAQGRESLALERPAVAFAATFLAGLDELDRDDERGSWALCGRDGGESARRDFPAYVQLLLAREHEPAPRMMPESVYWAIRDGQMVGRISLRHALNETLLREGGHIGYIVRRSARGGGIAREMLRQLLMTDRARAIGQLLLTCDEDNLASERAIRGNGGIFTETIVIDNGPPQKHFWISLTK